MPQGACRASWAEARSGCQQQEWTQWKTMCSQSVVFPEILVFPAKVQIRSARLNVQWRVPMHVAQTLPADPVLLLAMFCNGFINSYSIRFQEWKIYESIKLQHLNSVLSFVHTVSTRLFPPPLPPPHTHTHTHTHTQKKKIKKKSFRTTK